MVVGLRVAQVARDVETGIAAVDDLSIGPYLVEKRILSTASLGRAQNLHRETGESLETILTRLGLLTENDLVDAFVSRLGIARIAKDEFPGKRVELPGISEGFLITSKAVPIKVDEQGLWLAMVNPLDSFVVRAMEFATGKTVVRLTAFPSDIETALETFYGMASATAEGDVDQADSLAFADDDVERLRDLASEAPVIRYVNRLLQRAVQQKASDIHVEPMDGQLRVRLRIDGMLQDIEPPPQEMYFALTSRLKIMTNLDIAERRLAQDGRLRFAVQGKDTDFRVSTTPTIYGESVVLRILDRSDVELSLPALGLAGRDLTVFRKALSNPHGIVLVTGPTGSGKTTTLYASLMELNSPDRKILTIEDPVEYTIAGTNQVQVNPKIGFTFATALRAFLRQDPDIMMVGEIRDAETAQIGIQAALTGHMLLSTLHTNGAVAAISRLIDMGMESYLLASTISTVMGQRLVRKLCPVCRRFDDKAQLVIPLGGGRAAQHVTGCYRAEGCDQCKNSGYAGRVAIFEVLEVTREVQDLIHRNGSEVEIQRMAIEQGMTTMLEHGLARVAAGETTVEEVLRVTRDG
jgi:general secretion pathway protein E